MLQQACNSKVKHYTTGIESHMVRRRSSISKCISSVFLQYYSAQAYWWQHYSTAVTHILSITALIATFLKVSTVALYVISMTAIIKNTVMFWMWRLHYY